MRRSDARRLPIPDFSSKDCAMSTSAALDVISEHEEGHHPLPDYQVDKRDRRRNSVKFVNNFQNIICNIRTIEPDPDYQADDDDDINGLDDDPHNFPPPPPPLTAEELSSAVSAAYDASTHSNFHVSVEGPNPETNGSNDPSLIQPKPLHNPCLESKERQALHRELILNYKIGKDILQKPELNKVLRERKATQKKKEWEEYQNTKGRTSLEVKLEERANRMKEEEDKKMNLITEEEQTPELLRMHRKITLKPGKNEQQQS